jgi:hypothetical protein
VSCVIGTAVAFRYRLRESRAVRHKGRMAVAEQILSALLLALTLFAIGAMAWRDLGWRNRRRSEVEGEVVRFKSSMSRGTEVFTPVYRFAAEGGEHEVTDVVYSARPKLAPGDKVQLAYPYGRPDLARVPRPAMWVMVYALLALMAAMLAANLLGWLD